MSAVEVSINDIMANINKISKYYFTEAIESSNHETFVGLIKSVDGFLYKTFGDEGQLLYREGSIDYHANELKNWYDGWMQMLESRVCDIVKEARENIEEFEEHREEFEEVKNKAKIKYLTTIFTDKLMEFVVSKYNKNVVNDKDFKVFEINYKLFDEFISNKGAKKLIINKIISEFNKFLKKNEFDVPKKYKKMLLKEIIPDILKEIKENIKAGKRINKSKRYMLGKVIDKGA
jgi:hypothetical protein